MAEEPKEPVLDKYKEMFIAGISPLIKSVLLIGTGWLVSKKIWTGGFAEEVVKTGVPAIAIYIWIMIDRWRERRLFNTAAATAKPVSRNEVKKMVKEGKAPPTNIPANRVPYLPDAAKTRYYDHEPHK